VRQQSETKVEAGLFTTKRCRSCDETKPLLSFAGDHRKGGDGTRPSCRACESARARRRRNVKQLNLPYFGLIAGDP